MHPFLVRLVHWHEEPEPGAASFLCLQEMSLIPIFDIMRDLSSHNSNTDPVAGYTMVDRIIFWRRMLDTSYHVSCVIRSYSRVLPRHSQNCMPNG